MASSYIDLYTSPGGYYGGFGQLMPKPTIGVQQGTYRPGTTQRVVHDTLNNKYYGTQSLDSLTKGLQDAIARNEAKLERGGETYVTNAGTIFQREEFNRYDSAEIKAMNDSIAQQQKYLSTLNSDNYTQEASTFFDSYDAYTQDYNNIYQRTYNNSVQAQRNKEITARNAEIQKQNAAQIEKNRLQIEANDRMAAQNAIQERENEKTRYRNKKIQGEAQASQLKNQQGSASNNGARAKALTPNLEIGTGLLATAYRGLTNSGLTL